MRSGWSNSKHAAQWSNTLEAYAYPVLGDLPVGEIETAHVLRCLAPIWTSKTETANRLRGRIEAVLDWAKANGSRRDENPARWKGHLDKLLAAPAKVRMVRHHAALPFKEVGAFVHLLRARDGIGAGALEFTILTAARSGEVRGVTWAEVNLRDAVWTIPAERMKSRKEHRIPLSERAVAILTSMPTVEGCEFVFPGSNPRAPMSDMTLTAVLRRMSRGDLTVHGFRSTFRDWAAESTAYSREVAEMALAHVVGDAVESAYRRGDLFEKRGRMMADWAEYCGTLTSETNRTLTVRAST